jgi:formylglycine-generating enzyme required for sulfatase activity
VSWNQAHAYCEWLNRAFADKVPKGATFRLPTDAEWMTVAKAGDDRIYPWGNSWPPEYGNFSDLTARRELPSWEGIAHYDDGFAVTCPVYASGANAAEIFGLAGNVWEWCEDWYDDARRYKVRHGGCWDFDTKDNVRIDSRGLDQPDASYDTIGFRVVVQPPAGT